MERRFDMSDFEQALKDHADQFKMLPSKRVWNGIYNNLHPGSRWPSITVAVILMITLITLGNLNNSPKTFLNGEQKVSFVNSNEADSKVDGTKKASVKEFEKKKTGQFIASISPNNLIKSVPVPADPTTHGSNTMTLLVTPNAASVNAINTYSLKSNPHDIGNTKSLPDLLSTKRIGNADIHFSNGNNRKVSPLKQQIALSLSNETEAAFNTAKALVQYTPSFLDEVMKVNLDQYYWNRINNNNKVLAYSPEKYPGLTNSEDMDISIKRDNITETNSKQIPGKNEVNVSANKKMARIHKKRNSKIEWEYYVTPLVSNATFRGKPLYSRPDPGMTPIVVTSNEPLREMVYNARMGIETGVQMNYKFLKKWAFVTGVNLSYSGYKIMSFPIHPTSASLVLQDENTGMVYSKRYVARFGNGTIQNNKSLNNYSYQVSMPLGLRYTLWGNNNMQVNLLSSFAPTAILKSNAYIISSDTKYYVQDPSLLRPVNVNGSFEPTITFSAHKIKWHMGPQIRYQLLSTYKNNYSIKEHLINYGIKIGISR